MMWMWYLEEPDAGCTRLISRWRVDCRPTFRNRLMYGPALVGPISCVMSRKMLLGIMKRVEHTPLV